MNQIRKSFCRKAVAVFIAAILLMLLSVPAVIAASTPQVSISSVECAQDETVKVTISMKNAVNFTSGDLNVQYNPHILRFVKAEESDALKADKEITVLFSDPTSESGKADDGSLVHEFNISFFHLEKFPQSLNNCDVVTLTFKAVGSGECPLVLSATSFYVNEELVAPDLISGMATVSGGDAAESWDYGANADPDIMYTDPSYVFETKAQSIKTTAANTAANDQSNDIGNAEVTAGENAKTISPKLVIGIVVAVLVVIGVVAVVIVSAKKKSLIDE